MTLLILIGSLTALIWSGELPDKRTQPARGGFSFTDVTDKAGIVSNPADGGHGVFFADIDNDGDLDFYVTNALSYPVNVPNYLFVNDGGGGFADESGRRAVRDDEPYGDWVLGSHGAVFADLDRDGDLDLVLSDSGYFEHGQTRIFLNKGDGFFRDFTARAGVEGKRHDSRGVAVGDFNGDGRLDIVLTNTYPDRPEDVEAPLATERLWFGMEKTRFTGSSDSGLMEFGFTQGIVAADIDGDGDLDIVEARWPELNAGGRSNALWLNDGCGFFTDASDRLGENFARDGLNNYHGAALGDTDNDGDLDLLVIGDRLRFFRNDRKGRFTELTEESGLEGNAFSAAMGDLDQDGDLDVVVPNSEGDYYLFDNRGGNSFSLVQRSGIQPPYFNDPRAVALGDYDGDGDLDVVIAHKYNRVQLFRNNCDNKHFLKLRLFSPQGEKAAIGARVRVFPAGEMGNAKSLLAYRVVFGSSGYLAQNDPDVHIGLASARRRVDVEIQFPGGKKIRLANIKPGKTIIVDARGE